MVIGKSRTNQPVEDTDGAVAGLVEEMVESGDLDNAKPLYFHPITIYNNVANSHVCLFTMIIINNSATAFTKDTLVPYLHSHAGRYLLNGNYRTATFYLSPSMINKSSAEDSKFMVVGFDNNGNYHGEATATIDFEDIVANATGGFFADDVNKIN